MKIKIGDTVNWRGGFGMYPAEPAVVKRIEITHGAKNGTKVDEMLWEDFVGREAVVDLDNGHWAYASQISPLKNNEH